MPGTELGWGVQALGPEPSANIYDQYRYVVFKDPNWDWKTFNFDSDVVRGDLPENLVMNATDPNMKAFFSHGGKLLLYHGWSDPNVPTLNTIKYYKSVVETMGGPPMRPTVSGCSWSLEWATAAAVKVPMCSTKSARSSNGWSRAKRRRS